MKKNILLGALALFLCNFVTAQILIEKTDIRLHEHHTNDVSTVGGKSGYDLVNHLHIEVFGAAPDYNGLTTAERMNVDMHEVMDVNQASTMSFNFGFSSALDGFGDGGNNTTLYMVAPTGFDYDAATTMQDIATAFDPSSSTKTIQPVVVNTVYLAKIRNQNHYVAIKVTDAVTSGLNSVDEVYFDFDYKHPEALVSTEDLELARNISIYPQPVNNGMINLQIENEQKVTKVQIFNVVGKEVYTSPNKDCSTQIPVHHLKSGLYIIKFTSTKGTLSKKVIIN